MIRKILVLGLCLLATSCVSTRKVYRGLKISDLPAGLPSRTYGVPSRLKVVNEQCSDWTYYFEQIREPGESLDYPSGTLHAATYHYRPGGASSADFNPPVSGGNKYRLLRNDNPDDLRRIAHYKENPFQ